MDRITLKTISIFFALILPAFAQNPTPLSFNDLNAAARESYAAARALALKKDQPVFAKEIYSSNILYMPSVPVLPAQECSTWKASLIERQRWVSLEQF